MIRFVPPSLLASAALVVASVGSVSGATLVFENGDRLSGELIQQTDGMIVFESNFLGLVRVAADRATVEGGPAEDPPTTEAAAGSNPMGDGHYAAAAIIDEGVAADSTPAAERPTWQRNVEFGVSAQSGATDRLDYSLRLSARRPLPDGNLELRLGHYQGRADDRVLADATSASASLRRNLNPTLYVQTATRFDRDAVKGISHDAEQSLGLGLTALDGPRLKFDLGVGTALRHRDAFGQATAWTGLVDGFGRLACTLSERLSFNQDFWFTAAPDDGDDFKVKLHTALVNRISDLLQMSLRLELEHNHAAQPEHRDTRRLVTSLGCVF